MTGSRVILMLTAVLVVLTPWSEAFCHFDRFLYGGQDVELGLVALATFLCLVLLLARHGNSVVALSLKVLRSLAFVLRPAGPSTPGSFSGLIAAVHASPLPSPALGMYTLPIQV
ncbi:hypothetical protein [Granulicella sibirica]|uniref:Uncharacterized protein n=1 Tax=Granulicella sibirica TaxID=2479048 RepID=A0A4Q0SV51_9BACT|nr:hypothetical protein [Granulicella sibirica]RXH54637.1 hypothetical protein GRAN_3741 [Granulicella sibirica]